MSKVSSFLENVAQAILGKESTLNVSKGGVVKRPKNLDYSVVNYFTTIDPRVSLAIGPKMKDAVFLIYTGKGTADVVSILENSPESTRDLVTKSFQLSGHDVCQCYKVTNMEETQISELILEVLKGDSASGCFQIGGISRPHRRVDVEVVEGGLLWKPSQGAIYEDHDWIEERFANLGIKASYNNDEKPELEVEAGTRIDVVVDAEETKPQMSNFTTIELPPEDLPVFVNFTDIDVTIIGHSVEAYRDGMSYKEIDGVILDFVDPNWAFSVINKLLSEEIRKIYYVKDNKVLRYNVEEHIDSMEEYSRSSSRSQRRSYGFGDGDRRRRWGRK